MSTDQPANRGTIRALLEPFIKDYPKSRYADYKACHPHTDITDDQFYSTKNAILHPRQDKKHTKAQAERLERLDRLGNGKPLAPLPLPVLNGQETKPLVAVAPPITDKKVGSFDWREWSAWIKDGQTLKGQASFSQDTATIDFSHLTRPICVISLSDLHWGSWATDYAALERITDEILSTPDLYVALIGDLEQMAITLRSVLEVSDNVLPPELQHRFSEAWLDEMAPRILFATWENHSIMREEKASGYSRLADLLKRRIVYHNHIGHPDIRVGSQVYKLAVSHKFRGSSIENPCHAQMRYMRREGIDREIAIQGDTHVPGMMKYTDGAKTRLAINTGALQTDSGYGKRFFSLYTHEVFPCVELYPDRHLFVPYWSLSEWKLAKERREG